VNEMVDEARKIKELLLFKVDFEKNFIGVIWMM